jgi:hypothetical protein
MSHINAAAWQRVGGGVKPAGVVYLYDLTDKEITNALGWNSSEPAQIAVQTKAYPERSALPKFSVLVWHKSGCQKAGQY